MAKKMSVKLDWLAYSVKGMLPEEVMAFWSPYFTGFVDRKLGRYFFKCGAAAPGINVYWDSVTPDAKDSVMVEISGSGCDILYSRGFVVEDFVRDELIAKDCYHISRLDVCCDYFADDEVDFFPYDKLIDCANEYRFVSRIHRNGRCVRFSSAAKAESTYGTPGTTVYFGSAGSDTRLTTYNKLLERKVKTKRGTPDLPDFFDGRELKQWLRFEFRLRDNSALSFAVLLKANTLTEAFMGVLKNYITFTDGHHDRTKGNTAFYTTPCSWWVKFLEGFTTFLLCEHLHIHPSRSPQELFLYSTQTYFNSTTVTPSSPSPYTPLRDDCTDGCLRSLFLTAVFSAPVPLPWIIVTTLLPLISARSIKLSSS